MIEICFACKYISYKIQFKDYYTQIQGEYQEFIKKKDPSKQNKKPDFMRYEIEIYSLLGFDLEIKTPYHFFHELLPDFYNKFPQMKDEKK